MSEISIPKQTSVSLCEPSFRNEKRIRRCGSLLLLLGDVTRLHPNFAPSGSVVGTASQRPLSTLFLCCQTYYLTRDTKERSRQFVGLDRSLADSYIYVSSLLFTFQNGENNEDEDVSASSFRHSTSRHLEEDQKKWIGISGAEESIWTSSMTSRLEEAMLHDQRTFCNKKTQKQNKLSLHIEREETTRWECTDLATNFAITSISKAFCGYKGSRFDQYQVTPSFQPSTAKRVAMAESSDTMVIDRVTRNYYVGRKGWWLDYREGTEEPITARSRASVRHLFDFPPCALTAPTRPTSITINKRMSAVSIDFEIPSSYSLRQRFQ